MVRLRIKTSLLVLGLVSLVSCSQKTNILGSLTGNQSSSGSSSAGGAPTPTATPIPKPSSTPAPTVTPTPAPTTTPIGTPNPSGNWTDVTSNLVGVSTNGECIIGGLAQKPNEDFMLAVIATRGVWGSTDRGASWHQLAPSAGIVNRGGSFVFDPAHANTFWESGIYDGRGVFRTDDDGKTFSAVGTISHVDSLSIDFSDPNRQTLLAGGHEASQTRGNPALYLSQDGGKDWTNIGANLPAGTAFESNVFVVNAQTFFLGLYQSWGGGTAGVYQSNDSGVHWFPVTDTSFSAGAPLSASDGSIYWAGQDGSVMRATGSGQNWTFKKTAPSGTLKTIDPIRSIELPNGSIVNLSNSNVMISSNQGTTWTTIGPSLPFTPNGIAYASADNSLYIWHSDCTDAIPKNAIVKYWLN